jgi:hypothetical protein
LRQFFTEVAKAIIAELSRSWGLINTFSVILGAIAIVYWDTMIAMAYNLGIAYIDGRWHEHFALLVVPQSAPRWQSVAIFCVFWPPCAFLSWKASREIER